MSISIEWDEDYGVDHRHGWTSTMDGVVLVQLTSLRRALIALFVAWVRKLRAEILPTGDEI